MTESSVVSWSVNGEQVDLDLLDIDGVEWRDAKVASGYLSQPLLLHAALIDKDLGAIGALLWIARRRTEPELAYDTVLRALSIRAMQPATADG